MRIAFVGKGGSGKTTAAAVFGRYVAEQGHRVVAIDADINQHLAQALGHDGPPPRPLSANLAWLKDHLRGDNPRIAAADAMIKTTPPGRGSRLLDLGADDAVLRRLATRTGGVHHLAAGEFDESDIGVSCFHAKTGAVELYLNHLVDGPSEYVVVDMTAGADAFASGLFTRFDLTVLVCEPTRRGVGVYRQYAELAAGHGVALRVLGNKVTEPADVDFLRDRVGDGLLGWLVQSSWVRAAERGAVAPIGDLEPANRAVLGILLAELDSRTRDWVAYHRDTVQFHLRNAAAWANRALGADLPCRSTRTSPRARSCRRRERTPGADQDGLADGVERGRAFIGTISRTPRATGVQQSRSSGLWLSTWPRGLTNSRWIGESTAVGEKAATR